MQVTDELRVLVEAEVARAIENFKKLSDGVEDSEKKTASLGEALDSLSKKSLIMSGVLGGAGIAAVKFAGENEKLKLSLKNMLGSAEEASAVFEDWRRLGTSPGLSVDEVFNLGRAMVNMGHSTEYATSTVEMLGNVAAGTGISFGEISSSFERARAMGNLTSRDLVRLQQQGIPIVKELAKVMGTSEESIRQMASEGKIGFDALERSFRSMTGPGGQFAGMMDELSGTVLEKFSSATDDAKQALASFGETLLPIATEMLNGASSILNGIADMDDGTKRFVLGMGGVIAVSGPAIAAIKGISAAMKLAMANPYMLAIGGVIAVAGVVAGIINKQAHAYDDLQKKIRETDTASKQLLSTYADGNQEKVLDEQTTRRLIELYPELNGAIRANTTTVREAAAAQAALNRQRILDAERPRIERLRREQEEFTRTAQIMAAAEREYQMIVNSDRSWEADAARDGLNNLIAMRNTAIENIKRQQEEINRALAPVGMRYTLSGDIIEIPITVTADTSNVETAIAAIPNRLANARRTWQEWFEEITNVDRTRFNNSGERAAQLYLDGFNRTLTAQSNIAKVLEEQIDIASILRSRQSDVQNALVALLSINPEQINRPFTLMLPEIQKLIEEYRRLGEEAKNIEETQAAIAVQEEFARTIEDLTKKIDDLGKSERQLAYEAELARIGLCAQSDAAAELSQTMDRLSAESILANLSREVQNLGKDQYDLALATMAAANATEEQIRQAEELIETLRTHGQTFEDFIADNVESRLLGIFPEMEKQAAQALGNISAQLASISLNSLISGFNTLGEALGKGERFSDGLKQALSEMSQQILNQLPTMFLQAGLQLIAQGQWALGLGFIAAAGSSALISGFVNGSIQRERESASANAHGNAFNTNGVIPYAHGGSFTNQIVNKPTYFRHGGKLGVMGEAGPESIMPLRRMSNGDLGVAASGNGSKVTINIINNSGEDVSHKETENADGSKDIEIVIGEAFNRHIASGKADRAMAGRYGSRPVGV